MIKSPPRGPFQQEAVELALGHDGFLLFCEQRTGKCWIALSVVNARKPKHLWIVCPKDAIRVWKEQITLHLKVDWSFELLIMNYEELVARKKQYYKQAKGLKDLMIIGDETHKIKRRGNVSSGALRTLAKRARWRLGLSGTPMGNGLEDFWAQMDFVDPTVFGPFSSRFSKKTKRLIALGFEDYYLEYGGPYSKIVGYLHEDEFKSKIDSRSYRITLREARGDERPLKIRFRREWVDLDESTWDIYNELEEKLTVEVNKKKVKVTVIIALVMKLQQLTGGFVITEAEEEYGERTPEIVGSEKLRKLLKIVRRLREQEKKVVIVCRFLFEIDRICARLRRRGVSCKVVSGDFPFDGKFEEDCLVVQIQKNTAVDMSAADYLVFYSADYSYLNHEQMKFRILNFEKPFASFHYLLARGTIDEVIYEARTRKKNLAHLVLDKYRRKPHDREA